MSESIVLLLFCMLSEWDNILVQVSLVSHHSLMTNLIV